MVKKNIFVQVESVMFSLLHGEGSQSPDAYIDLLLSETGLAGRAVLVIEDLLYLAVRGGNHQFNLNNKA